MNTSTLAALAALGLASGAAAVEPVIGAQVGAAPAEIAAAVGESGYTVRRIERKGDRLEVLVDKAGAATRFDVDAPTGQIAALGAATGVEREP